MFFPPNDVRLQNLPDLQPGGLCSLLSNQDGSDSLGLPLLVKLGVTPPNQPGEFLQLTGGNAGLVFLIPPGEPLLSYGAQVWHLSVDPIIGDGEPRFGELSFYNSDNGPLLMCRRLDGTAVAVRLDTFVISDDTPNSGARLRWKLAFVDSTGALIQVASTFPSR